MAIIFASSLLMFLHGDVIPGEIENPGAVVTDLIKACPD